MKYLFITFLFITSFSISAQKAYKSFEALMAYAEKQSFALQTNDIKIQQAKQGKLAALLSVPDVNGSIAGSFTNNTKLPVSILPAQAFGGQPGETRELTVGTKYQTGFTQNLDIKLVNLEGYKNIQLSKINIQISESDALLNKKILSENIATIYYNILQLQEQILSTDQNIDIADTLLQITQNKYNEGLAKQQDVNDAKVSLLNLEENKRQIKYSLQDQYLALKIACDIPEKTQILLEEKVNKDRLLEALSTHKNVLNINNAVLKQQYAAFNLKKINLSFYPTLSFVANNGNNTYNQNFTILGGNWINSNYLGLRLNWNIPNANLITNKNNAKYNLILAQKATEQAEIKAKNEQAQLDNEIAKSFSKYKHQKEVVQIQNDTYMKNLSLFKEGILSLDKLLTSFSNKVNAEYNLINSQVNIELANKKIEINNKF
jgi:outer membrane protein TolC